MFNLSEEFEKNPELKQDDIDHIQSWLLKQPHLPHVSDQQIVLFLHSCNYKLELTKNTIDNYFTIRTIAPEIFSNRNPKSKEVQGALETVAMIKLPGKSLDGYDVFLSKLRKFEPERYVMADIVKLYNMQADISYKDEGTSTGVIYIIDMKGFTLGHVVKMNLNVMKHHIAYLQEALPMRLQGIHMINVVPFIDMVMNMLKPFMKSELLSLFHYHQANSEKLFNFVSKSVLPKDYGGEAASVDEITEETKKLLLENEKWFAEEEQRRVDESKRQGKSKLIKDEVDMSGSFKKLSFD